MTLQTAPPLVGWFLVGAMLLYGTWMLLQGSSLTTEKKKQKFDLILILRTKFGCSGAVNNCESIGGLD